MKKEEKKLIHRALDGEVTKHETKRLVRKIETDVVLRSEYEGLKKVVQESGKLQVDVPAGFVQRVLRGVSRQASPPRA